MNEQELEKRRLQQQAQAEKQQALDESLLAGDREAIARYSQPGAPRFRYSSKKNLARNYRDYALSRSFEQERPAETVFQKADEHLALRAEMLSGMDASLPQGDAPLPAGETPLALVDCVKKLCRCRLLEKKVSADELVRLTEHLSAGKYLSDKGDDPDAALHARMNAHGLDALGEIYARVLDALAEKYGDRIGKLSASDYLRALPEIEDDFACLPDMERFFTSYRGADDALRARLGYYEKSFAILRGRGETLASMAAGAVTEKGALTKSAEKDWAGRLAALRAQAAKDGVFRPRGERTPLAGFFDEAEQRRERANIELLNSRLVIAEPDAVAIEEETSIDFVQPKLIEYASIQMKREIADSPTVDEKTRKLALASIAKYEKSPEHLTKEQAEALTKKLNDIKAGFSTIPGVEGVDEENASRLIRRQSEDEQRLVRFLRGASDSELLGGYENALALARLVSAEMKQLENSHLDGWANSVRDHESGKAPLPPEEYARRAPVAEAYNALRALDAENAPLYLRAEKIILSRLRSIREYGCTQAFALTDETSPLAERARLRATDAPETPAPRFEEAKRCQVRGEIFDARDELSNTTSLAEMRKTLASMKTVAAMRREQPDYYRLGQSRADYLQCEYLADLLPACERAWLVLLRRNLLADRGGETQAAIEREWKEAFAAFKSENSRLSRRLQAALQIKDGEVRGLEENIAREEKLAETLQADRTLADAGIDEATLAFAVQTRGLVFVEAEHRETMVRDLALFGPLERCAVGGAFDEAAEHSAAALLSRFSRRYGACMDALRRAPQPFGDSALLDSRAELEACAMQADYISNFIGKKERAKLAADLAATPLADLSLFELEHFDERAEQIGALSRSATGLALGQAAANGATACRCIDEGVPHGLEGKAEIEAAGRAQCQSGFSALAKLRTETQAARHADELAELELTARVRASVGGELEASARKGQATGVSGALQRLGELCGRPLQFLSWLLHDKRTDRHGAVCYDECRTLCREKLENKNLLSPTLPLWQRGDRDCAPEIDLDREYGSPLKKRLDARLRSDEAALRLPEASEDPLAADYAQALEALRLYCGVAGVVNSDTTEMEMAFLDRFKKTAQHYRAYYESEKDSPAGARVELLASLERELDGALGGTLSQTLSAEELARIDSAATAYVEDTCYLPNMRESNIRDIPLFLHEPNINDVRQSSIGDCWLVSAVGTLAKTDPAFIRSMFHDLGDGNVLVRLYAADDEKTDVSAPGARLHPTYFKLRKQYETGWGNAADCTWVQLLEKAYALGGYNRKNKVEVRGDRLYNVAAELTLGNIPDAVAHLTGTAPQSIDLGTGTSENDFLAKRTVDGLLAGVDKTAAAYFGDVLAGYASGARSMPPAEQRKNCLDTILEQADVCAFTLSKLLLGSPAEPPAQEAADAALAQFKAKLRENFEKMRRGEPLDFGSKSLNDAQYARTAQSDSALALRRRDCSFFEKPRPDAYSEAAMNFYHSCLHAFEGGGAVSVSIPHCVSLLDAKEHNGRLFLLMRDPFNAYNTVYTMQDGKRQATEEGFAKVITARRENRRLPDDGGDFLTAAFRGTSWVELDTLFAKTGTAVSLRPETLTRRQGAPAN